MPETPTGVSALKNPVEHPSEKPLKLMKLGSASEIYRILPLGLTVEEARAWYVNRILLPRLRWASAALIAALMILIAMLTELGTLLEQSLTTHMVIHDLLFLLSGFLFAYGISFLTQIASHLSGRLWTATAVLNRKCLNETALSVLPFASAALLIGYWYLPAQFSAAAANVTANVQMQLALLFAGGFIFVGSSFLSRRLKLIALVIVGKVLGLYGMFLLLTPQIVYSIYPAYEQAWAGATFLFLMLILDFTIMPLWLYSYFGKAPRTPLVNRNMF